MGAAIILAGGKGTRLRSLVKDVPKPMAVINSKPFLEHQIDYLISQGINKIILSVGYMHEKIINYFGDSYKDASIYYSIERIPLGTGGALFFASQFLEKNEHYFVINGDTYFPIQFQELINKGIKSESMCTFSLFKFENNPRFLSVEIDLNGSITSLNVNYKNDVKTVLLNGGVYLFSPNFIQKYKGIINSNEKISLELEIFPMLIKNQERINSLVFDVPFIDIGIPEDYIRASKIIKNFQEKLISEKVITRDSFELKLINRNFSD